MVSWCVPFLNFRPVPPRSKHLLWQLVTPTNYLLEMLWLLSDMHMISAFWFSYSLHFLQPHLCQTFKLTLAGVKEVSLLLTTRICTVVYYHMAFSLTTAPLTLHPISILFSSYLSEERFMTTYRRTVCIWHSNSLNTCLKPVFISLHQTCMYLHQNGIQPHQFSYICSTHMTPPLTLRETMLPFLFTLMLFTCLSTTIFRHY